MKHGRRKEKKYKEDEKVNEREQMEKELIYIIRKASDKGVKILLLFARKIDKEKGTD